MPRPCRQSKLLLLLVIPLLVLATSSVAAQSNISISSGFGTEFKVWTSGGTTFVKVRLAFPDIGHSVSDSGTVTKSGDEFIADARVERWTGGAGQAITFAENTYVLRRGTVPGFDWLTQIIVRPPDELKDGGEIGVIFILRGMIRNRVLLNSKPSATNPQ